MSQHNPHAATEADLARERELERIRGEYHARTQRASLAGRYGLFNNAALLHTHSVEHSLLALLKRRGFHQLNDAHVLDVGCGAGRQLRRCIDYGAQPENLTGIDLLPKHIETARKLHPSINWVVGSAHELPFMPASFDLVMCSTVLSSILSNELRRQIATEMLRVVKPGGMIVIHDFVYSNPRNSQVRGVPVREMRSLFATNGKVLRYRRVVLAPPLARFIAPRALWLAQLLEHAKVLNTHVVAAIYPEVTEGR